MDENRGIMALNASGDHSAAALPPPAALEAAPAARGHSVKTATGKDRDMYGKKLGKVHATALRQMNESAWLTDADVSLQQIVSTPEGRKAFSEFLRGEYNTMSLDFVLEARLVGKKKLSAAKQEKAARGLHLRGPRPPSSVRRSMRATRRDAPRRASRDRRRTA